MVTESDYPLRRDYYNIARDECEEYTCGKDISETIDFRNKNVDSYGISGGIIDIDFLNVTEPFELHIWGYTIQVTIDCESDMEIPVYVHSTEYIRNVKQPTDDAPREIKEEFDKYNTDAYQKSDYSKEILDKYTEEVEERDESTHTVIVDTLRGKSKPEHIGVEDSGFQRIQIQ